MKFRSLIFLLLLLPACVPADELAGKVVHVSDGDSIIVLADNAQHKVRLGAIDAPERFQAFGNKSKKSLTALIAGKHVTVSYNKRDKYGRIVGKVYLQDMDVGLEQVKRGMAWFYRFYQEELEPEDRAAYAQAEGLARRDRVGLWADTKPVPPWEFRRRQ
jgi:endonuclease YncB( thermonuclease family)